MNALHLGLGEGISIHALHEESDQALAYQRLHWLISIHALHEESDRWSDRSSALPAYFNPRSP